MNARISRIWETIKSYDYRTMNYRLIIYAVLLSIIGILAISSATDDPSYPAKQIIGLIGGFIIMALVSLVKYEFIARYYWLMYFISILLLLGVMFFGRNVMGAKRWVVLFGIQFQPSEICKIMLLIFLATMLVRNKHSLNSYKFLIFLGITLIIPWFLIYREPDFSTSVVLLAMFCVIIFTSEISAKIIRKIILVAVPVIAAVVVLVIVLPPEKNLISEYQYNRIVGFYDEDNPVAERIRYQQENSVIAIASGGVSGKGLNNNSITSVKNADFISEPQTDFIFTIIGEELGLPGAVATIVLLGLIVFECFLIGMRAREQLGRAIAIGYGTLIAVQAFINLGVVTMIIPNTGLTLPFVSYGLSSLMTFFLGIGVVLNVGLKNKITIGGVF